MPPYEKRLLLIFVGDIYSEFLGVRIRTIVE